MRSPADGWPAPKAWLGLIAIAIAVVGAAACSAEPLMPGPKGGAGGGSAGQGGAAGATAGAGTMGAGATGGTVGGGAGDGIGAGGSTGTGGGTGGAPCASTASCAADEICTTQDGVCNAPPGCGMGVACPAVCYGNCRPSPDGPLCGAARCAAGMVCCNASCGICTPPNGGCTKQICVPPAGGGACTSDADCRLEADYCTGCNCRALAAGQTLPACTGPGVRCLLDPCDLSTARCTNGTCTIQ
jgi:hypothetical protein